MPSKGKLIATILWFLLTVCPAFGQSTTLAPNTAAAAEPEKTQSAAREGGKTVAPAIKILEANETDSISLTAFTSTLDDSVFLFETSGREATGKIRLEASDLRGPNGHAARVELSALKTNQSANSDSQESSDRLSGLKIELTPHMALRVRLRANLPVVGNYKGFLSLTDGNNIKFYTLAVTREKAREQYTLSAVSPPHATRWYPFDTNDLDVRLNLSETQGFPSALSDVILKRLLGASVDGESMSAPFEDWKVTDLAGGELFAAPPEKNSEPFALGPNRSSQLILKIHGLSGRGRYEGTVRAISVNGVSQEAMFKIFVKDPWLYPLLVILLGTIGSFALRWWLTVGRPRAVDQMALRKCLNQIRRIIADENDIIRIELEKRMEDILHLSQVSTGTDIQLEIRKIGEIVENYREVKAVLDLRPRVKDLAEDSEELLSGMNQLESRLEKEKLAALLPVSGSKTSALAAQAQKLREKIFQAAHAGLTKAIDEMGAAIEMNRQSLDSAIFTEQDKEKFKSRLDNIASVLASAEKELPETQDLVSSGSLDRLETARSRYEKARDGLAGFREEIFRHMLDHPMELPALGTDQYRKIIDQSRQRFDQEGFARARKFYLEQMLDLLETAARERGGDFIAVSEKAGEAISLVETSPDQAQSLLGELMNRFYEILARQSGAMSGTAPSPAVTISLPLGGTIPSEIERFPSGLEHHPLELPDLKTQRQKLRRNDILSVGIIGIVSVLIGLKMIWVNNPVFGSLEDYINAFLWGFGLHELTKVALPSAASQLGLSWFDNNPSANGQNDNQQT